MTVKLNLKNSDALNTFKSVIASSNAKPEVSTVEDLDRVNIDDYINAKVAAALTAQSKPIITEPPKTVSLLNKLRKGETK